MICKTIWNNGYYSEYYLYTLKEMFEDKFDNEDLIGCVPSMDQYADLWFDFDVEYWTNDTGAGYQLWTYIWNTYKDRIALITNTEWDRVTTQEVIDFWHNFYGIWNRTHKYYEKMLQLLKENEAKLLDQISAVTTSEGHFNDTPDQSGDYATLDYASSINKNTVTTKADGGTILTRLDEIRRRYSDYYVSWANEFDRMFISKLNYERCF